MAETAIADPPAKTTQEVPLVLTWTSTDMKLSAQTDRPSQILGEPVTYADKDIMRCGIFKVPAEDGSRLTLSVDKTRLQSWATKIREWVACGLNIPVIDSETHKETTQTNVGRIVDAKVVGDRLYATLSLIGDDARKMAARNEVSVMIKPVFVDGDGRKWQDVITHLALTPKPVVNQQELPKIAASLGSEDRPVILSYSGANMNGDMPPTAAGDTTMLPCSGMCMSELGRHVPGFSDVPHAGKMDHLLAHIKKTSNIADGVSGNMDGMGDGSGMSLSTGELSSRRKLSFDAALKLSNQLAAARQPEVREAALSLVSSRRDLCVQKGAVNKSVADKLYAAVVGEGDTFNNVALSRASSIDGKQSIALSIFSILEENQPIVTTQKTGPQRDAHSLSLAGQKEKTPEDWAKLTEATLALSGNASTIAVN